MTTIYAPNTDGTKTTITVTTKPGIGIHVTGGLPDAAVKECILRVATSLQSIGHKLPSAKITINFSNPDKRCTAMYDLPVALALVAEIGETDANLTKYIVAGELSLQAGVRPITDEAVKAACDIAKRENLAAILPEDNLPADDDALTVPAKRLTEVIRHIRPVYLVKHFCIDEDTSGDPVTEKTLVFHSHDAALRNFNSQKEDLKRRLAEQFEVIGKDDDEGDAVFIEKEGFCDAWKSYCAGEYEEWISIDKVEAL